MSRSLYCISCRKWSSPVFGNWDNCHYCNFILDSDDYDSEDIIDSEDEADEDWPSTDEEDTRDTVQLPATAPPPRASRIPVYTRRAEYIGLLRKDKRSMTSTH